MEHSFVYNLEELIECIVCIFYIFKMFLKNSDCESDRPSLCCAGGLKSGRSGPQDDRQPTVWKLMGIQIKNK